MEQNHHSLFFVENYKRKETKLAKVFLRFPSKHCLLFFVSGFCLQQVLAPFRQCSLLPGQVRRLREALHSHELLECSPRTGTINRQNTKSNFRSP
jgi:hypothetical protein